MKITPFWALFALAQAQGLRQPPGGTDTGTPVPRYPTPTPEVSHCEAELITTLCDYKSPGSAFAVASSGRKHCWEYCNDNPPCAFVIFLRGNPYTGSGTCWLYPGEEFDESLGEPGCDHISVYDQPVCAGPSPTSDACEATRTPSLIATACDYPTPPGDCWGGCTASGGASNCLSQCVESDSCSYVVFNPRTEAMSPYTSGTCWMYSSGEFDPEKAKSCKGKPEQFAYENPCPKPPPKKSSSSSSTRSSPAASSTSSSGSGGSGGDDSSRSGGGSSSNGGGGGGGGGGDGDSDSPSPSGGGSSRNGAEAEGVQEGGGSSNDNGNDSNDSPSMGVSLSGPFAVGLAVLMWEGIR